MVETVGIEPTAKHESAGITRAAITIGKTRTTSEPSSDPFAASTNHTRKAIVEVPESTLGTMHLGWKTTF